MLLKFLDDKLRAQLPVRVLLLLPEQTSAPWFRFLRRCRRIIRYRTGSDLFRFLNDDGAWHKCPATKSAYIVVCYP